MQNSNLNIVKPAANEYLVLRFNDGNGGLFGDSVQQQQPQPAVEQRRSADSNSPAKPSGVYSTKKSTTQSKSPQSTKSETNSYDFDKGQQKSKTFAKEQLKNDNSKNEDVSEIEKDNERNTSRCCKNKKCCFCLICLLTIVVIAAGAGVAVYFFWWVPKQNESTAANNLLIWSVASGSLRPSIPVGSSGTVFPTNNVPTIGGEESTPKIISVKSTTMGYSDTTTVPTMEPPSPKPPNLNPYFDVNPQFIRPIMYNLSLDLTPFSPANVGKAKMLEKQKFIKFTGQLNVTVTIETADLHAITVNVDRHFVNPTKLSWSQTVIQHSKTRQKLTFVDVHLTWGENTQLKFTVNEQLIVKDQYEIVFPSFTVENNQDPGSGGIRYGAIGGDGKESDFVTWTDFKLRGARSLFPCFDHPGLRASFRLQLKHDPRLTAISSQTIQSQLEIDDGSILSLFHPTPPISAHSLSFSLTNIKPDRKFDPKVEDTGKSAIIFPSNVESVDDLQWILRYGNQMITQMERITKKPCPTDVLYFIFPPSNFLRGESMDGLGLIFLFKNLPKKQYGDRKRRLAYHVARQWLGHSVTVKDWSQICLQEAFLTLLSKLLHQMQKNADKPNSRRPLKETVLDIIEDTRSSALAYRGSVISRKISDKTKLEDKCHSKAVLIFNMLMFNDLTSAVDDETGQGNKIEMFVTSILNALQLPGLNGSVDLMDWKKAVQSHYQHATDFDDVFDTFFDENADGYPLINARVSDSHLLLTQEPELNPLDPAKDTEGFITQGPTSIGGRPPSFIAVPLVVKFFTDQNRRVQDMKFVWNNSGAATTASDTSVTLADQHNNTLSSQFALPTSIQQQEDHLAFFIIDPDGLTLSRTLYHVQNYRKLYDHCFDEQETGYSGCQLETRQIKFLTEDFCYGLLRNKFPLITDPISAAVSDDKDENWKNLVKKLSQLSTPLPGNKKDKSPFFPKLIIACRVCACCLKRSEALDYVGLCDKAQGNVCAKINLLNDLGWND